MTSTPTTTDLAQAPGDVPVPQPRRRRWRSILLVTVIFLAGIVIGFGVASFTIHRAIRHFLLHPESIPNEVLLNLRRSLRLTPEQYEVVERIVRKHHANFELVRKDVLPKIQQEFGELDQEIYEVLDEKQRVHWKSRFRGVREMWFPVKKEDQ